MPHKKDYDLGEFSFYGRFALNAPLMKLGGKGRKGQDFFCQSVFTWLEYGHCPEFDERYEKHKENKEERKNGFKRQVIRK